MGNKLLLCTSRLPVLPLVLRDVQGISLLTRKLLLSRLTFFYTPPSNLVHFSLDLICHDSPAPPAVIDFKMQIAQMMCVSYVCMVITYSEYGSTG